jgi:hypothetical protein
MDSKYTCPHCEQHLVFDAAFTERVVQCPGCKKIIELPKARNANSRRNSWRWFLGPVLIAAAVGGSLAVRYHSKTSGKTDAIQNANANLAAASPSVKPPAIQARSFATDPEALVPMIEERLLTEWMDDLDLKNESEIRHRARDVIAQKAQSHTAEFIQVFENRGNKNRFRGNAILAIGFTGTRTGPEAGVLVNALKDEDQYVRCCAMESLRKLQLPEKQLVPLLAEMLNDPISNVRRMAAIHLGYSGVAAKDTLPALEKLTGDEAPTTRAAATEAIKTINKKLAAPSRPKE